MINMKRGQMKMSFKEKYSSIEEMIKRIIESSEKEDIENIVFQDDISKGDSAIVFRIKSGEAIKNNPPETYTIALLNIMNFKLINSSFGFEEGDKTLKYIHDKINENLEEDEFLCRSDIDNFFICIKENDEESIKNRLKKLEKV